MQPSQVRFEEGEGGSLAVIKLCLKGLTDEEDVQDNQYTAQYSVVTPVFSQACADLRMPVLFSGYLNCSHTMAAGCPAAASVVSRLSGALPQRGN